MFLASCIVCLTAVFKKQIRQKLGLLFREKKVTIISNGIDLEIFKPGNKIAAAKFCIGMQSRLVEFEDHLTLLKAFAIIKNDHFSNVTGVKLKVAGEGSFKEALVKSATELGIINDVEFTGSLDESELVVFLQNLDLYVHASLGETMSTANMQAMACKLPIIASDVDGINNMIIDNTTGLLVPPQKEDELANIIKLCISDRELVGTHAENGYQYATHHFSNQIMVASYKNIFL